MTRRINQNLAQKRKHNNQLLAEKEVKKPRKAEVVQTTSCLVVEQLVVGSSLALPAWLCVGEGVGRRIRLTRWMNSLQVRFYNYYGLCFSLMLPV